MDKTLYRQIIDTFGTAPLAGSDALYAKILQLPDNTITIYYVNADSIKAELESRNYTWNTHLNVWEKTVKTIEEALRETEGRPATAAALSQIN